MEFTRGCFYSNWYGNVREREVAMMFVCELAFLEGLDLKFSQILSEKHSVW